MDQRTRELAAYAASHAFDELGSAAVHECKRRLIDSIGCAIGAYDAEPARIARGIARRQSGTPAARIWGSLDATTPELASFANGVALRYADYNDAYFSLSSGHPSDTFAASLAMGDALHSDGRSVLLASALAYEVFCNLSDVLPREQGYDYVVHGVLASAVAAAKLLGLNAEGIAQAISLSIVPNIALEQTRLGELSMWKGCAAANASRNGLFAAMLAAEGMTGPDQPIEGKSGLFHAVGRFDWAPFGGRGGPYRVAETHLKYYPAVVHAQSPITAAIELEGRFDVGEIERVIVDTSWVARRYTDRASALWHPSTRETADHSLPYIVAAALLDGTITAESFSEDRLHDPAIATIMERMELRENPAFTAAHPEEWRCRIELQLGSARTAVAETSYFKGHARNPMTDHEVEDKFRRLASQRLSAGQVDALLNALWRIDEARDVSAVVDLLGF
ncbi:MAG: MmgE/PrpD family protein [Burkholderiales bacterium]